MSRKREVRRLVWYDQNGVEHVNEWVQKLPPTLGVIPKESRLVTVFDTSGDQIAVLASYEDVPPLLYIDVAGPSPAFLLGPHGFESVMWIRESDQDWRGAVVDVEPVPSISAICPTCSSRSSIESAVLWQAAPASPTDRTRHVVAPPDPVC